MSRIIREWKGRVSEVEVGHEVLIADGTAFNSAKECPAFELIALKAVQSDQDRSHALQVVLFNKSSDPKGDPGSPAD